MRCKMIIWIGTVSAGLFLPSTEVFSQQKFKDVVLRAWEWSIRPNKNLDSAYVFQPRKNWSFSAGNDWSLPEFNMNNQYRLASGNRSIEANLSMNSQYRYSNSIGVHASFGALRLGYSYELGNVEGPHRSLSMNLRGTWYGLEFRYLDRSEFLELSGSILNNVTSGTLNTQNMITAHPSAIKQVIVDGFYAFNRKRFSSASAYNGRTVQRRSVGSWMASAKYMMGSVRVDADEKGFIAFMQDFGRFTTHQFSLGGGYSFNWVPYHRNAVGPDNLHGLRNLTLNITAIPMITVLNRIISMQYTQPDPEKAPNSYTDDIAARYRLSGWFKPNFMARAGASFAIGHFYLSLWADYSMLAFSTPEKKISAIPIERTMRTTGRFSEWKAAIELNYRF